MRLFYLLFVLGTLSISGCIGLTNATSKSVQQSQNTSVTAAAISMSTSSVSFGQVAVGSTVTRSVILSNPGGSNVFNVIVSNVSISGAGFNASGVSTGQILTPGQTATLTVTFTPVTAVGVTGSVTVTSDATNSPGIISLLGSGVQGTSHSVKLSWTPEAFPVASYNVYRSAISGGPYMNLNSSAVPAASYTDFNVQTGQTYYYVATSVTSAGVESLRSTEVSAKVP